MTDRDRQLSQSTSKAMRKVLNELQRLGCPHACVGLCPYVVRLADLRWRWLALGDPPRAEVERGLS